MSNIYHLLKDVPWWLLFFLTACSTANVQHLGPPLISKLQRRSPLNLSGRTVLLLAISDPHINICVGSLLTLLALLWRNLIYYPLTHWFDAITLGWIENFGITLTKGSTYSAHPELLNSRVALYFPCELNHPLKFDWQTGETGRPKDKHVGSINTLAFETS